MALGNKESRDEQPKSKGRSLTALGQSLRRGLTTRRTTKASSLSTQEQEQQQHANTTTTTTVHGSTINKNNGSNSTLHQIAYSNSSTYTPSPLSQGATTNKDHRQRFSSKAPTPLGIRPSGSGAGRDASSSSTSSSSTMIYGYGNSSGARSHRIPSASGAPPLSSAGNNATTSSFRKTMYGSSGLSGLKKSGFNVSSPTLGTNPTEIPAESGSAGRSSVYASGSHKYTGSMDNKPAPTVPRKGAGPPPENSTGSGGAAGHHNVPMRDYSFAIAQKSGPKLPPNNESARSSAGGNSTAAIKEGYLSKKTDINPSTSIASALSRGWKVYRVVLKGAKLFFYKPPSESELRAMFPEEIAAATNETAGGYYRSSMTASAYYDDSNSTSIANNNTAGSNFPMTPGEIESGSRAVIFEPGVQDGEITTPLCERYVFGECFTEVDLRSLKFKRYVCVLIFDDTIVVLKRRWVRQGLASSFFGAVSNKMRFGRNSSSRANKTQKMNDNTSLVSAELGIQGKGYFTKWKFHSSYPLTNAEAIEAASSRFSIAHSPGMLGHLNRGGGDGSQNGSGRVSLYSIGNSSVSSVMTRTSTVSKDYSGALTSGLVPGFQIFVSGKQRVARMFVATTSDAKNNWLSRFAAAKAGYARKLRQGPRENTNAGNSSGAANGSRRPTVSQAANNGSGAVAGGSENKMGGRGDGTGTDDKSKPAKDTRTRLYWGTQQHPDLVVSPTTTTTENPQVVVGGSKSALVHEMIFLTTVTSTTSDDNSEASCNSFSRQFVATYTALMSHSEFLREFQRYSELVVPDIDNFESIMANLRAIILNISALYATAYGSGQIDTLRAVVDKTIAAPDAKVAESNIKELRLAIDDMVPLVDPNANASTAANQGGADSKQQTAATTDAAGANQTKSPLSALTSYEIIGMPLTPSDGSSIPKSACSTNTEGFSTIAMPMRGRSRTHHAEGEPIACPQIPSVQELVRVGITGLSPSLMLRISPPEFAHQLYLFHKAQLSAFDPKQLSLYMPTLLGMAGNDKSRDRSGSTSSNNMPSLLTIGTSSATGHHHISSAANSPSVSQGKFATVGAAVGKGITFDSSPHANLPDEAMPMATAGQGNDGNNVNNLSAEQLMTLQRQLMVFTHNEPHFITRLIHHQLLVDLPLNRPARRSALLQHWVRIGEECRTIGDAVSWAAIAMAITMAPIARLRETWHGVSLAWKELIATEWIPLLIQYGVHEADFDSNSSSNDDKKPLVLIPQHKSGTATPSSTASALAYSYTSIPYYGTIRISVNRQGRMYRRLYQPAISESNGGDSNGSGDKVLFAHYGKMCSVTQAAVGDISDIVVERARSSIVRSRASSLSLTSKFRQGASPQQQPPKRLGGGPGNDSNNSSKLRDSSSFQLPPALITDPTLLGHPYLQSYLKTLALNPHKIGDELVESTETAEYDIRFLLSVSLQCEPSITDQYQRQQQQQSDGSGDEGNNNTSILASLRQAPGSILPLVCPETVPSTNILQWISPAARTTPTIQSASISNFPSSPNASNTAGGVGGNYNGSRSSTTSGRSGTFSHGSTTAVSDEASGQHAAKGPKEAANKAGNSDSNNGHVLKHKRSRSFPTNVPTAVSGPQQQQSSDGRSKEAATPVSTTETVKRAEQQHMNDAARNDAIYTGSTVYAAKGDLSLRVLRVQYVHPSESNAARSMQLPRLRFVVEVQGGTLAVLINLLLDGIESYNSSLTSDKGVRIQLPGGLEPTLLFNRDVYQRTFMASFRQFCNGLEVVEALQQALVELDSKEGENASLDTSLKYRSLLDVCENWVDKHHNDFLDNPALCGAMTTMLVALKESVNRESAKHTDANTAVAKGVWGDLCERANGALPDLIVQLLTPSGFTPMDRLLERRLVYAINRERRSSTASQMDMNMQSPLSLLSVAEPDVLLTSLNRLAQTHFAQSSFNDWMVAFSLLEAQTNIPLPWYPKKRLTHLPSEDDLVVSDIYQVLEQTYRACGNGVGNTNHELLLASTSSGGVGVGSGVGGVASSTAETSLARTFPRSIQKMLELHRMIRDWVIRQIADPAISLGQRVQRIQKFLTVIKLSRKDSHLSSSRVFGGLLNSYMREAGMIPDRQPSYRTSNSIKGNYGVGNGRNRVTGSGDTTGTTRRGGRRNRAGGGGGGGSGGASQSQIKYVPAFVERAVASAMVSPQSRLFVRAWNEVAMENGTKLDTLEAVLRGARDWSSVFESGKEPIPGAFSSVASSAGGANDKTKNGNTTQQQTVPVPVKRSRSNPITETIDITDGAMARADCFVPCVGWLLENMVSLCYDTPDTLVGDSRLVNLAKRHRVFIMLCVCDQLAGRCQDAFAIYTSVRIDMSQLASWVAQTPLRTNELKSVSHSEASAVVTGPIPSVPAGPVPASPRAGNSSTGGPSLQLFSNGEDRDRSFTFSSPLPSPIPSHSSASGGGGNAGFVRSGGDTMPPIRHGGGRFGKRSMTNIRGAAGNVTATLAARGGPGKSRGAPEFGTGGHAFGSPPAPTPRMIGINEGPVTDSGSAGSSNANGTAGPALVRPFVRLVTDEVEKVRQEIRERERLERELRDHEQAIERQKNERTKMLKRQLKEQQQRRAKNEPLLKMANLMNKVSSKGSRESSAVDDGFDNSTSGGSNFHGDGSRSQTTGEGSSNRLSSASGNMRPRGPALPSTKPANVINLINSTITVEQGYTKRDHVFRIVTEEGGQYLLQAPDNEQMDEWIGAMRDAATEAAARRLTLFVEEAKKRNNSGNADGSGGGGYSPGGNESSEGSHHHQNHRAAGTDSDTTRSRFTSFLGGGLSIGLQSSSSSSGRGSGAITSTQHQNQHQQQGSKSMYVPSESSNTAEPKSFGVELAKLMPDAKVVPIIVEKCLAEIELRGLEEVGIYRVSGTAASVSRLRQLFNTDPEAVDLSASEFFDINVVSGIMKQFLRELPEPLMTYNLYEAYINAASIDDYDERLWAIKDLVQALPAPNYTVLKRLIEHLERVTDYEEVNHMYGTNLALVFGPSLLRPPPGSSSFALAMSNLGQAQSVIKNLILQYHWIFDVEEEAEPMEDAEISENGDEASESSKRNSVAAAPLTPSEQEDMDQLAASVSKLAV